MHQLLLAVLVAPSNPIVKSVGGYLYKIFHKDPFRGIYQANAFDLSILIPYFTILIILSIYGIHRYCLVYLYMKNRSKAPKPQGQFKVLPRVTIQLPDLQRALRGGAFAGDSDAHRLPPRPAGNPGARRLNGRDARSFARAWSVNTRAPVFPSPIITAQIAWASRQERSPKA